MSNHIKALEMEFEQSNSIEIGRLLADALEDDRQFEVADEIRRQCDEREEALTAPGSPFGERVMIKDGKYKGSVGVISYYFYGLRPFPPLPIRDEVIYVVTLPNVTAEENALKRQKAGEKGHIYVAVSHDAEKVQVLGKYLMLVNA